MKKTCHAVPIVLALVLTTAASALGGQTLEAVRKNGVLRCGVNTALPGFSSPDAKGVWKGLDVDLCRAVAAAVLGDAAKVRYVPLSSKERFTALQSGEVDLLSRNTTWTLTRDSALGLDFAGVNYYDGQGFMVRKDLRVERASELDGATVCINAGTTTELNLADYFRTRHMSYTPVVFDRPEETIKAFESGRCDVFTADQSQLYALRMQLKEPSSVVILPDVISKEPLGPAVRQGDDAWLDIVRWSLMAMLNAEELGVTSKNVERMRKTSSNPAVRRLLGVEGKLGQGLGLSADWAYRIIRQVGNYGESFERNLGSGSPLKIRRNLNELWSRGGLMYAPPVR